LSKPARSEEPGRGRSAATYRALLLAAVFFVAAVLFALLRGEPLDARILILYAGVGLFVGGLVTAFSERRREKGDASAPRGPMPQTQEYLERRRRWQTITAVVGPLLFAALTAVSVWLLFDEETSHRVQAVVFVVVFVVATILSLIGTLLARRATDRRIALLDRPSA